MRRAERKGNLSETKMKVGGDRGEDTQLIS